MRGIEALLLAAFAGLVGVGLWNARHWLPEWNLKTVNSAPADASRIGNAPGKPEANKPGNGKHGLVRNGRLAEKSDAAPGSPAVSETTVDVPRWLPPFPTRADLPIGASGAHIRSKYGEPTARVTETRAGQLVERYYYLNADRTQLTVATLEGGLVTHTESVSR